MTGSSARRSPWTSPRDRVIAVAIALGVATTGMVVWATSDSVGTESTVARTPARPLDTPSRVPNSFTELWRAPSAATPVPVAQGSTVVTGDSGEVIGRDPLSGFQRWRYARDTPLCTVAGEWSKAIAVFTKGNGCSEVTALDADTGRRAAQRNGDAEAGTQLLSDGSHLVTTGTRLINVWSQELLRAMEFGELPAPVNPGKQPRAGCEFSSIAIAHGKIGTVARCPGEAAARLIVFTTTHYEKDESRSDEPKELYSAALPSGPARVVAISGPEPEDAGPEDAESEDRAVTAVALAEQKLLLVYGPDGKRSTAFSLDLPEQELAGAPAGGAVLTSHTETGVYWFTGSRTIALAGADLRPRWTLRDTIGTTTEFGGRLLVPITGGLAVVDEQSGETLRTVAVDRGGYAGPVRLASVGPVLLEQRGDLLVALR
ncbi:MAG: Rv3212 family protein [Haloechinothrix sp.]